MEQILNDITRDEIEGALDTIEAGGEIAKEVITLGDFIANNTWAFVNILVTILIVLLIIIITYIYAFNRPYSTVRRIKPNKRKSTADEQNQP